MELRDLGEKNALLTCKDHCLSSMIVTILMWYFPKYFKFSLSLDLRVALVIPELLKNQFRRDRP